MSFDQQMSDKQYEYMEKFPEWQEYPVPMQNHIVVQAYQAAKAYTNAEYSGALHDGGAGRKIEALIAYVRGFNYGRTGIYIG